jgi:LPS export ABC transporter protein LptC
LVFISSCTDNSKTPVEGDSVPSYKEGAEQLVLVDMKKDKKNWILRAEKAESFDDSIIIFDVKIDFFDAEGVYNSTLTSDSGVVYSGSGDMRAKGQVKVVAKDSTELKTSYLDWDNREQKIITEDFVEITKKNSIITGKGMESDPNLEHIEIKENFNAVSRDIKEDSGK